MDHGKRLKEMREAAGLKQWELARRANLENIRAVEYIESREEAPLVGTLRKILLEGLGSTLNEFFGDEPPALSPKIARLVRALERLSDDDFARIADLVERLAEKPGDPAPAPDEPT